MAHHWPKELLIWHCTVLFGPDGAVSYDYIVTNSINSLLMAQDVFSMVHTLYLVEPIWPILDTYLGIIHRKLKESIW